MKNYESFSNQRKNFNITHDRYVYSKENSQLRQGYWSCAFRKGCATGKIQENDQFIIIKKHNGHFNDEINILRLKNLKKLKRSEFW